MLYFHTYHRLLRAHAERYEAHAYADDRTLYKVSPLTVSLTSQGNSYKFDQEELERRDSRRRIRNIYYRFYLTLPLILHDYRRRLLLIYSDALSYRNLFV